MEEVFGRWGSAIAEVSDEERSAGPEPPLWTPKLVSYLLSVVLVGYSSTTQILRPEGDEGDYGTMVNTYEELLEELVLIIDVQDAVTAVNGIVRFIFVRHRQDVTYFKLQLLGRVEESCWNIVHITY